MSKCVDFNDREVAPLFGDAGSATLLVHNNEKVPAFFSLQTDGTGADTIKIPGGAFAQPDAAKILQMNGPDVFNFSLREVPLSIKEILNFSKLTVQEIDAFILHQANKYILTNIAKRCEIPLEKLPVTSLSRFGNTSSASIPLALCVDIGQALMKKCHRLLLSGFGVGLSWGSAILEVPPLRIVDCVEYSS